MIGPGEVKGYRSLRWGLRDWGDWAEARDAFERHLPARRLPRGRG